MMNRRIIFHGPRDIRLEESPVPAPGPGEIVVKMGAALTCGTDFKAYRQGHRVLLGDDPSPFGHELAGTVSAIRKNEDGQRATASWSPTRPMDDCFWCANGQNLSVELAP